MKDFLRFLVSFARSLVTKGRYVRLSPFQKKRVYFYDRLRGRTFSVKIRDRIDSITADQIFTHNEYDLSVLRRYDELMENYLSICGRDSQPLIVDCGANIGLSALHFANCFPAAQIVCVEPQVDNFMLMRENCAGRANMEFLNKAVSCVDGYVSIDDEHADNNAYRTSRAEVGPGVIDAVSVDSILRSNIEAVPFIIKIDIEGFEEDLFSGNTTWVEKFPILIIETHDWMLPRQAKSQNFLKIIADQRRDFLIKGENVFSISNS